MKSRIENTIKGLQFLVSVAEDNTTEALLLMEIISLRFVLAELESEVNND